MKKISLLLLAGALCFSCDLFETGDENVQQPEQPGNEQPEQPGDTQPEPATTVIYYDDLDKAQADGSWLDRWNGYINAVGIGAADISYVGSYVKTRCTFVSTGYPGASGYNGFLCSAQNGTTLSINGIRLPSDCTGKYVFSAGFNV